MNQTLHAPLSRTNIETLMDIATTLADYTQSAASCEKIPEYLRRTINLGPLTLAVIETRPGNEPAVVRLHASTPIIGGEQTTEFQHSILEFYRQTRPLTASDAPILRPAFHIPGASDLSHRRPGPFAAYPAALVFSRNIDEQHVMLLILHCRADAQPSPAETDLLLLIVTQLAKLLRCVVSWKRNPGVLGTAFERLTEREWAVLQALDSDDGEKQLADRLQLSPHTLHSHIKSIYRKVGVQGRLPLLLRVQHAMRELRATTINARTPASQIHMSEHTVAAG